MELKAKLAKEKFPYVKHLKGAVNRETWRDNPPRTVKFETFDGKPCGKDVFAGELRFSVNGEGLTGFRNVNFTNELESLFMEVESDG